MARGDVYITQVDGGRRVPFTLQPDNLDEGFVLKEGVSGFPSPLEAGRFGPGAQLCFFLTRLRLGWATGSVQVYRYTCGPAQGPPDPVVGSALWRPEHRIMKTKLKKKWREQRAGLGARRQRPDSDPALALIDGD
eukprot:scaffold11367_cov142-Isochrysis_galbana.AAC.2